MGMKLKELWITLKEFFRALIDSILGIFVYSFHYRKLQRQKQKQDEHYYFREESKRKMSKWVVKERKKIDSLRSSNVLPKKYKGDYSLYNYVATVLMTKNPNWTVEQTVKHFYDYFHPYMIAYWSVYRDMKALVNSQDAEGEFRRKREGLQRKLRDIPDMYSRATQVLDVKKKISQEIKEVENKYQKHKKKVSQQLDLELVAIDKKIAEKQKLEAEKKLKDIEEAKKDGPI